MPAAIPFSWNRHPSCSHETSGESSNYQSLGRFLFSIIAFKCTQGKAFQLPAFSNDAFNATFPDVVYGTGLLTQDININQAGFSKVHFDVTKAPTVSVGNE
jgi:hypothetical protein